MLRTSPRLRPVIPSSRNCSSDWAAFSANIPASSSREARLAIVSKNPVRNSEEALETSGLTHGASVNSFSVFLHKRLKIAWPRSSAGSSVSWRQSQHREHLACTTFRFPKKGHPSTRSCRTEPSCREKSLAVAPSPDRTSPHFPAHYGHYAYWMAAPQQYQITPMQQKPFNANCPAFKASCADFSCSSRVAMVTAAQGETGEMNPCGPIRAVPKHRSSGQ